MNTSRLGLMVLVGLCVSGAVFADIQPSVTNVSASQRTNGTGIVDIYYTLTDPDSPYCNITVTVSSNGGSSYTITPSGSSLSGDVGQVTPGGTKHILWYSKQTLPEEYGTNYTVRVCVEDHGVVRPIPVSHFLRVPASSSHNSYTFEMGDHFGDRSSNELPVHTVTVDAFYLCKYEVTNRQYCDFLRDALSSGVILVDGGVVYAASDTSRSYPYFSTYEASFYSQISYTIGGSFYTRTRDDKMMDNYPVVMVSWYGAKGFCDFYGYRLPTEAEWECAAQDGNHYFKYPWGNNTIDSSKCNYDWNNPMGFSTWPYTTPVGHYGESRFSDMAGNVWEWVNDWYGLYMSSPETNPTGPTMGIYRVFRGASWMSNTYMCRVSYRTGDYPRFRGSNVGFRACVSPSSLLSAQFCTPSAVFPINNATLSTRDVGSLLEFVTLWLSQDCSDPIWCEGYDFNESGTVDLEDFAVFAENWLGD